MYGRKTAEYKEELCPTNEDVEPQRFLWTFVPRVVLPKADEEPESAQMKEERETETPRIKEEEQEGQISTSPSTAVSVKIEQDLTGADVDPEQQVPQEEKPETPHTKEDQRQDEITLCAEEDGGGPLGNRLIPPLSDDDGATSRSSDTDRRSKGVMQQGDVENMQDSGPPGTEFETRAQQQQQRQKNPHPGHTCVK
ncbi:uncharacterized protein LOC127599021 isoform X4 [Hippocampus zosterae]|uniref:uncharacterized protein LOC127599021 isoform X4 n=1 Tax=Hippocampus zosterae TaxID=109293 RepID=UPI00223C9846|nr:uncharacterized protein LOC127599021 isoform X4 [Hippocampus zosterae]